MKTTIKKIHSIKETGQAMLELVKKYHSDVSKFDDYTLFECFEYVKKLPYISDPEEYEAIQRPKATMSKNATFRDCDDKAIFLGACLYRRKIPFNFVAVSEIPNNDYHHVLIEAYDKDKKITLDCTYPQNVWGRFSKQYKRKVIA